MKKIIFRLFLCAMLILAIYAFKSEFEQSELAVAEAAAKPMATLSKKTLTVGEKYTIKLKDQSSKAVVTYKSSNSKIATVSNKGVIDAVAKGSATITVTIKQGGKTYTSKIAVTVKAENLYDKFIKIGNDFYKELIKLDQAQINYIFRNVTKEEIIKKIYAFEYMINFDYLDVSTKEKLMKNKLIDIKTIKDDVFYFSYIYEALVNYYIGMYHLDLSELCINQRDKENSKIFYDTLVAITKDESKLEEYSYDFAYAGKNDIRTNLPIMYDEMTNCEKMIYHNFLYSVFRIVSDDYEDLDEELRMVYNDQSNLWDELIQVLSDDKPAIADHTRILWVGGETFPIRIRNLNSGSTVTYKSSNSKIATVSKDGTVKPIAKGTAQITATIKQGGKSYSSKINIAVQPPQVAIINRIKDLNIGDTVLFMANSSSKVNNYEWSSSDSKLIKIDKKTGKATALATGDVTITVKNTSDKTKNSITFRIYEGDLDIARYYGTFAVLESVPLVGNYHYEWAIKIDENGITYADRSLSKVWSNSKNVYPISVVNARFTGTGRNEKDIAEFTLKTSNGELNLEFLFSKYLEINPSPITEGDSRLYRISEEEFKERNAVFKEDWKPYIEKERKFYGTWYNHYKVEYQGEEMYVYDTLNIQFKTDGDMSNYLGKNYYHKEFQDSITFDMKFDDKYETVYIYLKGEKDWKFKFKIEPDGNGNYYGMAKLVGIDSNGNTVEFMRGFG